MKNYKQCQSCGTPFNKLPENEKVSENEMYCTLCWKDGEFIYPDLTLERMQKEVYDKILEFTNYPKFIVKTHVDSIKNLERWKK